MSETAATQAGGILGAYGRIPLFLRILAAMLLGVALGIAALAGNFGDKVGGLKEVSGLILALLKALATPLILLAVLHAILRANVSGAIARRLGFYLVTNTLAAIAIGLLVANVVQPGRWGGKLPEPTEQARTEVGEKKPYDALEDVKSKIPTNIIKPLYDDNVIAVIILAIVFGIALRRVRETHIAENNTAYKSVEQFIETSFEAVMTALLWIVQMVPIAVFCVVASTIGTKGFGPFVTLGGFIIAVLIALTLQVCFYLARVRFFSWVTPRRFLSGGREALLTAFSTASSTVTMPITYNALKDKVGLREQSATMGALVGSNFNNDGTALYEAIAPLFVAQAVPSLFLTPLQQIIVAFMAVIASVGAAGIPEAGLVTMLLVFKSVNLPVEYVLLILPVDWFLDRCRTAVNVMGDMTVACLMDGSTPEAHPDATDAGTSLALPSDAAI